MIRDRLELGPELERRHRRLKRGLREGHDPVDEAEGGGGIARAVECGSKARLGVLHRGRRGLRPDGEGGDHVVRRRRAGDGGSPPGRTALGGGERVRGLRGSNGELTTTPGEGYDFRDLGGRSAMHALDCIGSQSAQGAQVPLTQFPARQSLLPAQ